MTCGPTVNRKCDRKTVTSAIQKMISGEASRSRICCHNKPIMAMTSALLSMITPVKPPSVWAAPKRTSLSHCGFVTGNPALVIVIRSTMDSDGSRSHK